MNQDLNTNNLWFKRKSYGWGWYPVSWQGWATILVYVFVLVRGLVFINIGPNLSVSRLVLFFFFVFFSTFILVYICYKKGEKPCWQWGGKPISQKKCN